jgi:hypothetical protein
VQTFYKANFRCCIFRFEGPQHVFLCLYSFEVELLLLLHCSSFSQLFLTHLGIAFVIDSDDESDSDSVTEDEDPEVSASTI